MVHNFSLFCCYFLEQETLISFHRQSIPSDFSPFWSSLSSTIHCPVEIHHAGTIESSGSDFIHLDFANKYIGGGILHTGAVQEEIRFLVCPELIIGCLLAEELGENECLFVHGIEQFSTYEGYGRETFRFAGNHVDTTPM